MLRSPSVCAGGGADSFWRPIANGIIPSVIGSGRSGTHAALNRPVLPVIVVGQFALLATWAVLGPGSCTAVVRALASGWGYSWRHSGSRNDRRPPSRANWNGSSCKDTWVFRRFCCRPVPLWSIRLLRGCEARAAGTDAARTAIQSRQLEIRDILIVMTILAVFLGTMNTVAKWAATPLLWSGVLRFCGFVVVWTALVLPSASGPASGQARRVSASPP